MRSKSSLDSNVFGTSKYYRFPDLSNSNHMRMKEMFDNEKRQTNQWQKRSEVGYSARLPGSESSSSYYKPYGSGLKTQIMNNLKHLSEPPRMPIEFKLGPHQFARTNLRNTSFDPIIGSRKVFGIPHKDLRPLGAHGGGQFYSFDFHRLGPLFRSPNTNFRK